MYDQNIRINAAIAYFFLWPLFLLAKSGTPLAHPFVRNHAKKASLIFGVSVIILIIFSSLKPFLQFGVFGFSLYSVLMSLMIFGLFVVLIFSGYQAYNGASSQAVFSFGKQLGEVTTETGNYSEAEKAQIFVSFLPFCGIFLAVKNPLREVLIGRKVGNTFMFLIILSVILFGHMINTLSFVLLLAYIIIIVSTAVLLFGQGKFLHLRIYDLIPSYHRALAYIHAALMVAIASIGLAFGRGKWRNFQETAEILYQSYSQVTPPQQAFWMHPAIIAIPLVNLLTIPSLFQEKYQEYRDNIYEWLLLSLLCLCCVFFWKYQFLYLLVFPLTTLWALSGQSTCIRAPITSVVHGIRFFLARTKKEVTTLQTQRHESIYTFESTPHEQPHSTQNITPSGSSGASDVPSSPENTQK